MELAASDKMGLLLEIDFPDESDAEVYKKCQRFGHAFGQLRVPRDGALETELTKLRDEIMGEDADRVHWQRMREEDKDRR